MKSFQNFGINIVEAERRAYGNPTGYGPGGEPMYTKRPGPREPGRRATVQSSPQSVASVKADIEARRGFSGARSGGLENRPVPDFVTDKRQARATAAGTPDPWTTSSRRLGSPLRAAGGSDAFSDFLKDFSKETGISRGEALRQTVSGIPDTPSSFRQIFGQALKVQKRAQLKNPSVPKQLGLFGSDQPVKPKAPEPALAPTKPVPVAPKGQLDITDIEPPKPEPVSQAQVSQQAAKYRKAQTAQRVTTAMGGTPSSVSFSTPTPSKASSSPKTSVLDVTSTEVKGSKFAEPAPKALGGLSSEPAGPLVSNRPGQSQTIRPQQGPGRTSVLGRPRAGAVVGAQIEPVRVADITQTKAKITGDAPKTTPVQIQTPPKPSAKTVAAVKPSTKPVKVSVPAPAKPSLSAKNLGKIVTDVMKTERQARAAEKAASAAKAAKAIGRVGTLGAVVSSGIEAKGEFDRARREGASRNRAFGAGVARALGGLGGSALGALGGGAVAGLPGAFIGGTAGYTGGANLASAAYKQITGDNKQKLTTQRVLSNIRKTVPLEVRREVPAGARKAFRDLVTQTGRTYGNWRRSQEK